METLKNFVRSTGDSIGKAFTKALTNDPKKVDDGKTEGDKEVSLLVEAIPGGSSIHSLPRVTPGGGGRSTGIHPPPPTSSSVSAAAAGARSGNEHSVTTAVGSGSPAGAAAAAATLEGSTTASSVASDEDSDKESDETSVASSSTGNEDSSAGADASGAFLRSLLGVSSPPPTTITHGVGGTSTGEFRLRVNPWVIEQASAGNEMPIHPFVTHSFLDCRYKYSILWFDLASILSAPPVHALYFRDLSQLLTIDDIGKVVMQIVKQTKEQFHSAIQTRVYLKLKDTKTPLCLLDTNTDTGDGAGHGTFDGTTVVRAPVHWLNGPDHDGIFQALWTRLNSRKEVAIMGYPPMNIYLMNRLAQPMLQEMDKTLKNPPVRDEGGVEYEYVAVLGSPVNALHYAVCCTIQPSQVFYFLSRHDFVQPNILALEPLLAVRNPSLADRLVAAAVVFQRLARIVPLGYDALCLARVMRDCTDPRTDRIQYAFTEQVRALLLACTQNAKLRLERAMRGAVLYKMACFESEYTPDLSRLVVADREIAVDTYRSELTTTVLGRDAIYIQPLAPKPQPSVVKPESRKLPEPSALAKQTVVAILRSIMNEQEDPECAIWLATMLTTERLAARNCVQAVIGDIAGLATTNQQWNVLSLMHVVRFLEQNPYVDLGNDISAPAPNTTPAVFKVELNKTGFTSVANVNKKITSGDQYMATFVPAHRFRIEYDQTPLPKAMSLRRLLAGLYREAVTTYAASLQHAIEEDMKMKDDAFSLTDEVCRRVHSEGKWLPATVHSDPVYATAMRQLAFHAIRIIDARAFLRSKWNWMLFWQYIAKGAYLSRKKYVIQPELQPYWTNVAANRVFAIDIRMYSKAGAPNRIVPFNNAKHNILLALERHND